MSTDPSYPIVFLPGIMGSRLYLPNSGRYWDPDNKWKMLVWVLSTDARNRDELHGSQPANVVQSPRRNEFNADQERRGWGGVSWEYYGGFLEFLEGRHRNPVYAMGYDWRQDIGALGSELLDYVRTVVLPATRAAKVVLITHSMGGLVARSAFRIDPTFNQVVDKSIFICQPSVGAVLLHRRLFTGMDSRYDSGWGFRKALGDTREAFLGNVSGLPGAMQLLPSGHFPLDGAIPWNPHLPTSNDPSGIYGDLTHSPPGLTPYAIGLSQEVVWDLEDRVVDINAFHQSLGAPNDPVTADPGKTWLVYGNTLKTETKIQISGNVVVPVYQSTGDEVVPEISATALALPSNQMIAVPGITHEKACLDRTVQAHVNAIL